MSSYDYLRHDENFHSFVLIQFVYNSNTESLARCQIIFGPQGHTSIIKCSEINAIDQKWMFFFHFQKAFNQYLQLDGPPEANVFLSVAEDGYMSKWEITSDWDDISSMFM